MGLESPTFIDDLVVTNPEPEDKRRFGDDHLRGLKVALKNTFPSADGAINPSVVEFNFLVGVTEAIQTQLDRKLESTDIDLAPYARMDTYQTWSQNQRITPLDHGNQSGNLILDMQVSNTHIVRAVDNLTLSFSNLAEGMEATIKIIQGADSPAAVVNLPSEVRFAFGASPTLTTTLDAYDVIAGRYIDGALVSGFISEAG